MYEFARSEDEIAWGQLRGLTAALTAIGGILFAIFRKPRIASIAVIPNVVPLIAAFGFMGIAQIPLDAVTVGLGCTALGIAVDDTIHIVVGYRDRIQIKKNKLWALDATFEEVLPAVVYTTIAIMIGFGVLALSSFTVTQNLGFMMSGLAITCLLADCTLLPALLVMVPDESE